MRMRILFPYHALLLPKHNTRPHCKTHPQPHLSIHNTAAAFPLHSHSQCSSLRYANLNSSGSMYVLVDAASHVYPLAHGVVHSAALPSPARSP